MDLLGPLIVHAGRARVKLNRIVRSQYDIGFVHIESQFFQGMV